MCRAPRHAPDIRLVRNEANEMVILLHLHRSKVYMDFNLIMSHFFCYHVTPIFLISGFSRFCYVTPCHTLVKVDAVKVKKSRKLQRAVPSTQSVLLFKVAKTVLSDGRRRDAKNTKAKSPEVPRILKRR